jgi:chromatin remodeling complex protein RSC6
MSTEIETPAIEIAAVSSVDQLKSVLQSIADIGSSLKALANTVRVVIKDTEKQSKDFDKLRNKRSRNKAERSANALPSGITKPVAISDELAKFLGVAPGTLVPRNEVTKGVSGFVRENNLSDPANKQRFILDDRPQAQALKVLLGNPTDDVTYFNLQRYLKHHYLGVAEKPVKVAKAAAVPVVPETPAKPAKASKADLKVDVPATATVDAEKKKKVVLVKKKTSQLVEEP